MEIGVGQHGLSLSHATLAIPAARADNTPLCHYGVSSSTHSLKRPRHIREHSSQGTAYIPGQVEAPSSSESSSQNRPVTKKRRQPGDLFEKLGVARPRNGELKRSRIHSQRSDSDDVTLTPKQRQKKKKKRCLPIDNHELPLSRLRDEPYFTGAAAGT